MIKRRRVIDSAWRSRRGHNRPSVHCGPTLGQAVSHAARCRLFRNITVSRRAASSASAARARVITSASTAPVRAEETAPSHRAPAPARLFLLALTGPGGGKSQLERSRLDPVCPRDLHRGCGAPRMVGPDSRILGRQRSRDQEDSDQADPQARFGPVTGPAQRIAVQPENPGQPTWSLFQKVSSSWPSSS